jgi:hypothetical protein
VLFYYSHVFYIQLDKNHNKEILMLLFVVITGIFFFQTSKNLKQNILSLTTTGTSGAATLVGATLNIPQYQGLLTNPITGTGTINTVAKFTSSSAIGNSTSFNDNWLSISPP